MTEAGESGERLWDACMDYADLLEQQAFEMGFIWSAGLREELRVFGYRRVQCTKKARHPAHSANDGLLYWSC